MTNQEKVSPVISVVEDVALTSNRDGCVTAEVYSSIEEEYKCVRSSVGISDLSHYGRIRVSGQSGQDLINSLTLSDVATVPINEMQSTFILADDGAPLCEAFICNYGDSYLVLSEGSDPTQLLGLMEALSEDRFPDAQVTDESGSLGVIGLDGPFSWELLKAIMGIGVIGIRYLELVPEQSLESIEFTLGRAGKSGEYGYLLICDLSEFVALWGHLTNLGKDFDMRPLGYRVLDLCKLENRFVSQHNEGKVVSNVLELNTRVMFNIDKGEHAGRDSLEKIMACGVERRVIGVRRAEGDDAELEKGLRVSCGGEQIGELVNAGFSSVLNSWIGLALVDADYAYVGLEYSLESDKESTNAKTVSAPFVFNRSMDLLLKKKATWIREKSMTSSVTGAAITGLGAICSIGKDIESVLDSVRSSKAGFGDIRAFDTDGLKVRCAAEIHDFQPTDHFSEQECGYIDRSAQLAIVAVREAVNAAGLGADELSSGRVALALGVCAGGIGNGKALTIGPDVWANENDAWSFYNTAHYQQTNWVAADLGLTGPCVTVSTACASSTSAMATALTLLEGNEVEAVIVGGADAYSLFTYAGFYALGAMSENPTSPFSKDIGVSFGEGAGCMVIESAERARKRGASIHGTLLGCGTSSDAYHVTSPHPSGAGLLRAMKLALSEADLAPASIDYINAHGTGTQDNDVTETLGIRSLYENDDRIPPVSSSKSFFGHTLGAAGVLEFIVSLLGMKEGFFPPTLNFTAPRAGCDLDYVPNSIRKGKIDTFMSTSAAFGGVNAVAIGGLPSARRRQTVSSQEIFVTGQGVISPIGVGLDDFLSGLRSQRNGIRLMDKFDTSDSGCHYAGLVPAFKPQKLVPTVDVRRLDSLTRFAVLATAMAMQDAGLTGRIKPERVGLFVALTRGPVATQEAFLASLDRDGIAGLSARYFPSMVLSTLSGQIAQACRIQGSNFTFVDGAGAGLVALIQARQYLVLHPELDAIVVVAADELAQYSYRMFDRLGRLATGAEVPAIYSKTGSGLVLGEGAVAMVVERADSVSSRKTVPYGRIAGAAQGCEGKASERLEPSGERLEEVARQAISEGGRDVDLVYGMGRGVATHDMREAQALNRLLRGKNAVMSCLNGQLGLAEASSGLFAASAALLGLRHGEAYPAGGVEDAVEDLPLVRGAVRENDYRNALVLCSTESGNNFSVVFSNEQDRQ